jgi:hypothetical protein
MIFIVLLVIVFGMVLSTMQFGSMPDGGSVTAATPRAQVYAVNMETWHQAAMLALSLDATAINNDPNCNAAGATACDLNKYMRDPTTFAFYTNQQPNPNPPPAGIVSPLIQNWPEYVPVVAEGDPTKINSGGWQSFLIKNINGVCANPPCPATGTENYVLTVFRGYGYGGNYTNSNISSNTGNMSNAQIATALAKTVQDRMGVGNLQCSANTGICNFTRAAAYTPPGVNAVSTSDLPLQFPLSVFTSGGTPLQGSALPAAGTQPLDQVFGANGGLPAIMTRVGGGSSLPPPGNCPAVTVAWSAIATNYPPGGPSNLTYQCAVALTPSSNGVIISDGNSQPTYSGNITATCNGSTWNLTSPTCNAPGGGGSCSGSLTLTWGSGCEWSGFLSGSIANGGDTSTETNKSPNCTGNAVGKCSNGSLVPDLSQTNSCTCTGNGQGK